MMAAIRLPLGTVRITAAILAAVFVLLLVGLWLARRQGRRAGAGASAPGMAAHAATATQVLQHAALCLGAGLLALGLLLAGNAVWVRPVAALAGREGEVTARVLAAEPGYDADTAHAEVQVLAIDGEKVRPFRIQLRGIAPVQPGQLVRLPVHFSRPGGQNEEYSYSKGIYIQAGVLGPVQVVGESHSLFTGARRLQYAAGDNIKARLPQRLSQVAAAMAVGDRRYLSAETKGAYRAAGISHVLVVSGLHLSVAIGGLYRLLRRILHRRRLAAALGIVATLCFMLLCGLTPSVVRSGTVWMLIFLATVLNQRADAYTSLGVAALVLLVANPYAAGDVGLLLSFAATLGALGGGQLQARLALRQQPEDARAKRMLLRAGGRICVPVCVTLATLPVLIYAGMGISLFSVPANLLVVPFLPALLVCGFLMAIPAGIPVLGLLGIPAALAGGVLLRGLELLTGFATAHPGVCLPLGGGYGLVVVLVLYGVWYYGLRRRIKAFAMVCSLALCLFAVGLHSTLQQGTVKVTLAGSGPYSSLVVMQGDTAVVLYRGRASNTAIQQVLRQNNIEECALFVDLRQTAGGGDEERFAPRETVLANTDLLRAGAWHPFEDVEITLARQAGGTVACVDVGGYKVGLYTGGVSLAPYAQLDVLVVGGQPVYDGYESLLYMGELPEWADEDAQLLRASGDTTLWIRPGKSVVLREVQDGDDLG